MELVIDREFQELLPRLSPEAFNGLQDDILTNGCRDPLVIWNGIIIDGHNRYDICRRNGTGYKTVEMDFASRDDVLNWIDDNQLHRRNLTPEQISLFRGRRYNRMKKADFGTGSTVGHNVPRTSEAIATQYGVNEKTIRRDGEFAAAVEELKSIDPTIEQRVQNGDIHSKPAIIEAAKILKPHVANNSGNNEWYTPAEYIAAAQVVMCGIDLDPASSEIANKTVRATIYYNEQQDGLSKTWNVDSVWMNPPYAADLIGKFCDKFAAEFRAENFTEGIVLVNNATETKWFSTLIAVSSAVVFPNSRIKFLKPEGDTGSPLQGQAIIYAGDQPQVFLDEFKKFGWGATL